MLAKGQLLGHYKIVGVLGVGVFSVTYLAIDEKLERKFAIKAYCPEEFSFRDGVTVKPRENKGDDFSWGLERFIQEARVLAKFTHPNIVGVNQIIETNNTAYIVLEYQSGRSLKDFLKEIDGPPTQDELDGLLRPILDALELIHKNNLLHRDIAPDNIYIRDDGSPVLLDFGSARESLNARSKTVSAIIKSGYSPPEQYSSKGSNQGPWTDIYSLGATIYQSISGFAPEESTERLLNDNIKSSKLVTKLDYRESFLEAIDLALKLQPKDRPQDIKEWRNHLFNFEAKSEINLSSRTELVSSFVKDINSESLLQKATTRKSNKITAFLALIVFIGLGIYFDNTRDTIIHQNKDASNKNAEQTNIAKTETKQNSESKPVFPSFGNPRSNSTVPVTLDGNTDGSSYNAVENSTNDISNTSPSVSVQLSQVLSDNSYLDNLSDGDLCKLSLNYNFSNWEDKLIYSKHVNETKRRGITIQKCHQLIFLKDTKEENADLDAKESNLQYLCRMAIDFNIKGWSQTPISRSFIDEAKRRGLTEKDCIDVISEKSTYKFDGSSELNNVSPKALCKTALNSAQDNWEKRIVQNYVIEADRRGYSIEFCQNLITGESKKFNIEFQNLSNHGLCTSALSRDRGSWSSSKYDTIYVLEAQKRNLTVQQCKNILGINTAVNLDTNAISFEQMSSEQLCMISLSADRKKWDDEPRFQNHIKEALSRNLNVQQCRNILGIKDVRSSKQNSNSEPVTLSNFSLCFAALSSDKNSWDTSPTNSVYVAEAKRRDLSISQCKENLSNAPSNDISTKSTNFDDIILCTKALSTDKLDWEQRSEFVGFVDEAKAKNLSINVCRNLLGLSSDSPVLTDASSLSSYEKTNFRICNNVKSGRGGESLSIVLVYPDNGAYYMEGWFEIEPGACEDFPISKLSKDSIFLHSRSDYFIYNEGQNQKCVNRREFDKLKIESWDSRRCAGYELNVSFEEFPLSNFSSIDISKKRRPISNN